MVESPTYYHSLSPVLRSLKEFDLEDFPLQREVIYTNPSLELPDYLKEATLRTSIVCSIKTETKVNKRFLGLISEEEKDSSNTSEECKEELAQERDDLDAHYLDVSGEFDLDISSFDEMKYSTDISKERVDEDIKKSVVLGNNSLDPSGGINSDISCPDRKKKDLENIDNMINFSIASQGFCHISPSELQGTLDNNGEQMDTDPTLRKRSSSKVEENDGKENPAPITVENCASQEKLARRMEVERFLEVFNASSESFLEASQCEALVHALKNRLAVIQGKRSQTLSKGKHIFGNFLCLRKPLLSFIKRYVYVHVYVYDYAYVY